MKTHPLLIALLLLLVQAVKAEPSNFVEGESHAWASNVGWINFKHHRPFPEDGVIVKATHLSGYAWSDTIGWINLGDGTPADGTSYANTDGSDFGVNRDGAGNLSGYAWSNIGWINFSWTNTEHPSRPRFDIYSGQFTGFAWAPAGSWINLGTGHLRIGTVVSADASLASLTSSVGTVVATADGYTCDVPSGTASLTLTPTASQLNATIKVNGSSVASSTPSGSISLGTGCTVINVVVTAQDGITSRTYPVVVNVLSDSNADLAGLSLSDGALAPAFASGTTSYSAGLFSGATSVTVTPVASNPAASITVNGSAVTSGAASQAISLSGVIAPIQIVVTAVSGSRTYTVTPSLQAEGRLAFASTVFTVTSGSTPTTADIVINRIGSTSGTIGCLMSSTDGSAISGTHYSAQTNTAVTLTNNVGQLHLSVPIAANVTSTTPKSFTLTLFSAGETNVLASPSTATVVIQPATAITELVKPVVNITAPAATIIVDTTPVTVSGLATDNVGVRRVQVSGNNGLTYTDATLASPGATSTTYSFDLVPMPGINYIKVRAFDIKGNISTASREFTHKRTLTVGVNDTLRGYVTSGFSPTSVRQAGLNYYLAAFARTDYVFDHWSVNDATGTGLTPEKLQVSSIHIIMQPGLVLTAHFIANPFSSAVAGTYTGLVTPSATQPQPGGTAESNETIGLLQNVIVQSTGAFSGVLKMDGSSLSIAGVFDNQGIARFGSTRATSVLLTRTGRPSLEVALQIDLTATTGKITGTVSRSYHGNVTAQSIVDADRAQYSATAKVPATLAGTTSRRYTLALPAMTQTPALDSRYYPQGDGIATMILNADGTINITGKLADNTAISLSARLSRNHAWPLFQQLYSLKGCIAGMATLTDASASTEDITGTLAWFRPQQSVQWYPDGWTTGITTGIVGARYDTTVSGSVFPGLQAITPNARSLFSKGQLSADVQRDITISATNAVTTSLAGYTMTITKTTGLSAGTFNHTNGTKPAYQAVILQKGSLKGARGYFMTTTPSVINGRGESGSVFVTAK